jgi:hypothetical protein
LDNGRRRPDHLSAGIYKSQSPHHLSALDAGGVPELVPDYAAQLRLIGTVTGQRRTNMEFIPIVWLLGVGGGTIALGLAMAYAIMMNRTRTPEEKRLTDVATKQHYEMEDREGS